jgi:hypothetical protein
VSRATTGSSDRPTASASGTGRLSGTIIQMTRPAITDVPAFTQNSRPYPSDARTPALTVETEKPRLIAQNRRPYARTRSVGCNRSATVACTAGRNRSPSSPTRNALTQISAMSRAEPSRIRAAPVPKKQISIVSRRPTRSARKPPQS